MKVLVTGGCGYKGTVLVDKLLRHNYEVVVYDTQWFGNFLAPHKNLTIEKTDIRNVSSFKKKEFEAIIHLAAVANDPSAELNPVLAWEVNALSTLRLADAAVRAGILHFIYASSGSVYGVKEEPEVTEDLPLVPISEYNKTKMLSERVLLSYTDDMDITIIRPATVCGYSSRMRFDVVVNMFVAQALENRKITVLGGDQERPHIHIQDIVDLYIFCLENPNKVIDDVFNAGFENIKVKDLALMVKQTIEQWGIHDVDIEIKPSNDPRSYHLNSDKILATGFKPSHTVKDAIEDIVFLYRHSLYKYSTDNNFNVRWMKKCGIK